MIETHYLDFGSCRRGEPVEVRDRGMVGSPWGPVVHLMIRHEHELELTFDQLWMAFQAAMPDRWAVEVYPPASCLVDDGIAARHLWVLPDWADPGEMRIDR